MEKLQLPEGYRSKLDILETEIAIKQIKDYFQKGLSAELHLTRVSAPLFVQPEKGLNDDLNDVERAVSFDVPSAEYIVQIVHSLAKWKRMALHRYGFRPGSGLYTDMNAIRRDEDLDNTHSVYVDQWDWEKIIKKEERNEKKLKEIVIKIYKVFRDTEIFICKTWPILKPILPTQITFITTQELEDKYPGMTSKEREDAICRDKGAVFIMKIGGVLASGYKHDGRAPDYDDWELNGDILLWYPVLNRAMELSSMGIRVDEESLDRQLNISGHNEKRNMEFHKKLLNGELPYTIGGGIGQSRLCMYFLRKAHIGEVQASIWSDEMVGVCAENGIDLL